MRTLLLILLLVPMMSFGQKYTEGFPNGYIEPSIAFTWFASGDDYQGELEEGEEENTFWIDHKYSISPIGYNSSGHLAIRVSFIYDGESISGVYLDDYIVILDFTEDVLYERMSNSKIIDKLIIYNDINELNIQQVWKNKKSVIDSFLKKHNIIESFIKNDN